MLVGDKVLINKKDKGIKKHLRGQEVIVTKLRGQCFCFEFRGMKFILPKIDAKVIKE